MSAQQTNQPPVRKTVTSTSLAAILMMVGLLLSKMTGQLREILIAPIFGFGTISDAYIMGFQIPDLFYQLLVGGAIQAAITPTLAAAIEKREVRKGWRSVSIFINITSAAVLLAVVIGELLAPVLIPLFYGKSDPGTIELAIQVTRALFPQVFFMMMAALCIGILNAYKKFGSTSFGPSVYNVCVILAMVMLGEASGIGAIRVAAGVMLAACVYFVMQFMQARQELKHYTLSFDYHDSGFRKLLKLAVPTLISGSIIQINMIILTSFAGQYVGEGAVTALRYASTTWQLPYGIFAVAVGIVMMPSLAGFHAVHDYEGSRRLFVRSMRSVLFIIIPSAALFLVMRQDVVRAIFQWGSSVTERNVEATAAILGWYCLAMIAQAVVFLVNQAFYARKMTKVALLNGLITLVLNALLCWFFFTILPGNISNLSLAYAITSIVSAALLYTLYCRSLPAAAPRRILPFIVRTLGCVLVLLLVVLALNSLPVVPAGKLLQLLWFGLRALIGFTAFFIASIALKMPEAEQIQNKIHNIFHREAKLS